MHGCLCVNICKGVKVTGKSESIIFSGAGVTNNYQLPNVFAEN